MFSKYKLHKLRKRLNTFLIVLVLLASTYMVVMPTPVHAFAGGAGTVGDPYQITTAAELASLNSYLGSGHASKYFKVMNDIDLNVSPYNTGSGWTPIGNSSSNFHGKFDGNYKTISNLFISTATGDYQGLFGHINSAGTVSNTLLSNANVSADHGVGALAGYSYGTITRAGVTGGSVTGVQRVGGLIGSSQGPVTYAFSNNSVYFNPTSNPTCCAGGLAGEVAFGGSSANINNSYSRSSLTITYNIYNQGSMGGFLGNDYSSGAKSNLYSTGAITMVSGSFPSNTGGLSGGAYTSITSSYWDTESSGRATSNGGAGVVGKTTAQMKTQETYTGWDFDTIWGIDGTNTINNGYPYLRWSTVDSTPPTITNVSSDKANGSYTTGEAIDIDVTFSEVVTSTGSVTVTLETGATDRTCTFSISSSTMATCNYTVQSGDASSDLTVSSISGTIADIAGNPMSNFVPATNLAANKALVIDTTNPSTPGIASTTTPTTLAMPTWVWSASTDSGSGLAATPYTIQWSQSSSFASGVSAATSSTNSYTHSTALVDGTWYLRALATDSAGNNSSYASGGSVVIDTTSPTTPSTPIASTEITDNTPTWSWTASTDVGVGLSTNPYTVQWSKDSTFTTGVSATTSDSTGFVHSTALDDGTWYFRVKAKDLLDNYSSYSTAGSIKINTAVPTQLTVSTIGRTATLNNTNSVPKIFTITGSPYMLLNEFEGYLKGTGKKLMLTLNQVVHFKVSSDTHSATVKEVAGDYAVIVLASEPMEVRLNVGETNKYDVTKDGKNDISITLEGVYNGVASLTFAQVLGESTVHQQSLDDSPGTYWWVPALFVVAAVAFLAKRKIVNTKQRNR